MNKKTVFIVSLLMTLFLIGNVLAVTAKIGNAKMTLRAEIGDEIEKYVQVINDNDVAVNIALTASGDLKDYITIKDTNFTLEPGTEKKAYFTIEVVKEGTTESRINIQFTPVGAKNGVGLSSAITVIADGTNLDEDTDETDVDENTDAESSTNPISVSIIGNIVFLESNKNLVALGTTMIIALVFIILLIIYYIKFKKKTKENMEIKDENIKKTKLKKRVKKRV